MESENEIKKVKKGCLCPYCDTEMSEADLPTCQPCGITFRYCATCTTVVKRDAEVCPHCGGKLDWK